MDGEQRSKTGRRRRPARCGYDAEERAYADWMHRFVERLARHVPIRLFPNLMPIAAYWASHARHMAPEDAAQVAALWCCPEAAAAGTAACEEAAATGAEFDHLCQLEQHICDATARIAAQERLIEWLGGRGHEIARSLDTLEQLRHVLDVLFDMRSCALRRWGRPPRTPIIEIRH